MWHVIDHPLGAIDYEEQGEGPAVVLVPGSCSTGAAWRSVVAAWSGRFRCITTSLLGYGGTVERRRFDDCSIAHEAAVLETVIEKVAAPVHVVGHSFGGLVALAVALRGRAALQSLTILEAPVVEILRNRREDHPHYVDVRRMSDRYFSDFLAGDTEAVRHMVDFYGGAGTFAAWPPRVRAYATETTPANILDWSSAFGFPLLPEVLARMEVATLVAWGSHSHPAIRQANRRLGAALPSARCMEIGGAAHFMIVTHAPVVADMVEMQVAEAVSPAPARSTDLRATPGRGRRQ
jgi:pimeloyl-ACP methyl ester carboxylesterase